ncbi:Glycoside hydrolase family 43 [Macrophomina phaseolina MS6]|uniref:Glycoside hydrolase family 43 n=1 Tax=Macrophomina phaseolina (strain MS6) TaxID=1126212 RepID=K2RX85_MACPH|nr:Glycoside hydrolase family 43 [Macrophomina phaseolina MS6]
MLALALAVSRASAQTTFSTENFQGILAADSQVLRSLKPASLPSFDFSPADVFDSRNGNGNYHTGDLTFRYRTGTTGTWQNGNTAAERSPAANATAGGALAAANLGPTLGDASGSLNVTRRWIDVDGDLGLEFTITNVAEARIEIGSLGLPIEFNNIFTARTAVETRDNCVLLDPYIGLHAGYVQATRLTGTGPNLVITPLNEATKFEAWRFLPEESVDPLYYQSQTYEGNYEWQVHTKAWAENEWSAVEPWNEPTSSVLEPGADLTVGLRFSLAASAPDIEQTVQSAGIPLAVGIPGYILPTDLAGRLFLHTNDTVASVTSTPAGALALSSPEPFASGVSYTITPAATAWGRARLTVTYASNKTQTIHYRITKPAPQAVADLGAFLTTEQWYTSANDPFGRSSSIISYDRSAGAPVLQDARAWIAGLSDEAGAGSFVAAALKQAVQPAAAEVAKLEAFVARVVRGTLQVAQGSDAHAVRKSVFFHEPALVPNYTYRADIDWNTWSAWDRDAAYAIDRGYDYVHVTGLYWGLYRAGRAVPGVLVREAEPVAYLRSAYETVMFMMGTDASGNHRVGYWDVGQMGETVYGHVLEDLRAEGLDEEAGRLEDAMRTRAQLWATQEDPFGSEMAWDSTGQEGVYYWTKYFNDTASADKAVASIIGYMPTVAHWGWNGNARRYWDFIYGGKLARLERQIHHYGSGLNALPLLSAYRSDPTSLYLLRVGHAGNTAPLSNIDEDGFAAAAFHSWPDTLAWDAYSGDYGPGFLGHVLGSATYLVEDPVYGWVAFGGNVNIVSGEGGSIDVEPRDAARKRLFVAGLGAYVQLDAGVVESFSYVPAEKRVVLRVKGKGEYGEAAASAVVTVEQSAVVEGVGEVGVTTSGLERAKGGWVVDLSDGQVHEVEVAAA